MKICIINAFVIYILYIVEVWNNGNMLLSRQRRSKQLFLVKIRWNYMHLKVCKTCAVPFPIYTTDTIQCIMSVKILG